MNNCTFFGRLGADPEIKNTNSGQKVARFRLAMSKRWKDKDGNVQENTTWATCIAYSQTADILVRWARKGNRIAVQAMYEPREYEANGARQTAHEFKVVQVDILDYPAKEEHASAPQAPVQQPVTAKTQRPLINDFSDDLPF
jgi:single-strand DNA-binding protein